MLTKSGYHPFFSQLFDDSVFYTSRCLLFTAGPFVAYPFDVEPRHVPLLYIIQVSAGYGRYVLQHRTLTLSSWILLDVGMRMIFEVNLPILLEPDNTCFFFPNTRFKFENRALDEKVGCCEVRSKC